MRSFPRSFPLVVHVSVLFGLIIALTGSTVAWFSYVRTIELIEFSEHETARRIAGQITADLRTILIPAKDSVSMLSHHGANVATSLSIRLGGLKSFREALLTEAPVTAFYIGYDNGDFFLVRRLLTEADRRFFDVGPNIAFIVQSIEHVGDHKEGMYLYLDRSGEIMEEVAKPDYATRYDPRTRPWYLHSNPDGPVVITQPYPFSTTAEIGITLAKRADADGSVVGGDISLASLADTLRVQKPTPRSRVALIDGERRVIAFDDPVLMRRLAPDGTFQVPRLSDFAVEEIRRLDPLLANGDGKSQQIELSVGDEKWRGEVTSLVNLGDASMRLVVISPEAELFAYARDVRRQLLTLTGVIVCLSIGANIMFSRWLTAPLRRLAHEAGRVREFKLDGGPRVDSRIFEVGELGRAVDSMKSSLRSFGAYIPTALVRNIVASGQAVTIGGTRRVATVMFSDIEDFTKHSERIDSEQLFADLSVYFSAMAEAIIAQHGMIDKYIGDSVMAIWNAPTDDPDHVLNACYGVLACQAACDRLNAAAEGSGLLPVITRFGLHSGEIMIGNIGSGERIQYTGLGSPVNTASRIESINKPFGSRFLASETVALPLADRFVMRMADLVQLNGLSEPVRLYEIFGEIDVAGRYPASAAQRAFCAEWIERLEPYQARDWVAAQAGFLAFFERHPTDSLAKLYAGRCARFIDQPPGDDWDGIGFRQRK